MANGKVVKIHADSASGLSQPHSLSRRDLRKGHTRDLTGMFKLMFFALSVQAQ